MANISVKVGDHVATKPSGHSAVVTQVDARGTRVKWDSSGHEDDFNAPNGQLDGDYWTKMSTDLDAVDLARTARCSYCRKNVALHARTLGDHRAAIGICDGSGCKVSHFDTAGRAVFEAPADFALGDLPGPLESKITQVKAKIRDLRGYQADPAIAKQISDLENWLRSVGASA